MLPETLLGRVRFLLVQPVDAIRYAQETPADELGDLKAAAFLLLAFNLAAAMSVYQYGDMLDAVPGIGASLHTILIYAQRVFDLFAWGMFFYLVILRRRA
ncbi:hypothetical protein [Paracoccus beibuensis]|uniref:hypothetical protein n=1 Tax=Paracoccus beibuensis TaxID=547602 RepID=UPI00223F0986|nr:hypothetical protein [Paracoccus beibuensis]